MQADIMQDLPAEYDDIRSDPDIQFEPLDMEDIAPREPSAFEQALRDFFNWLGDVLSPVANALAGNWSVIQWVLIAALIGAALYIAVRLAGPLAPNARADAGTGEAGEPEWQPDREETLALLEEADRLAAEGRFDEAAHLLLKRSVNQIAAARPDWVEPSSTARELASLPRLSGSAAHAFRVISEAVERSLFALRELSREDWERAREAYADFALARIDGGESWSGKGKAR